MALGQLLKSTDAVGRPQRFCSDWSGVGPWGWGALELPGVPRIQPDLRTARVAGGVRDQGGCLPESWLEQLGDLLVPLVGWESPGRSDFGGEIKASVLAKLQVFYVEAGVPGGQ